jgi:hypothetical protein
VQVACAAPPQPEYKNHPVRCFSERRKLLVIPAKKMHQRYAYILIQGPFFACTINLKRRSAANRGKIRIATFEPTKMLRDARMAAMTGRAAAS